jgi:hypothetical protein
MLDVKTADALLRGPKGRKIAAALIHTLLVFNRVEYTGENPPWEIFERIFPAQDYRVLASLTTAPPFTASCPFSS